MKAGTVNVAGLMRQHRLKIKIVGRKRLKIRLWLGVRLIEIACFIIGCNAEISHEWTAK